MKQFIKHLEKNKNIILIILAVLLLGALVFITLQKSPDLPKIVSPNPPQRVWQFKSIDTMKYSRDLSGQALDDPTFDTTINTQVKGIAEAGANYVAIATPYDERFVPVLIRWVKTARNYKLHVWFRGNFSGWEGWFGSDKNLTRGQHQKLEADFINNHGDLFQNGDAFSPCPECENGGPGDPRYDTSVNDFRNFMIAEKKVCDDGFKKVDKNIICNLAPMNYDVANLVFDKDTTSAMENLIVIDHYVSAPQKLSDNIDELHNNTGANIMLGEIGVPIPDINGKLTDQQQADWLANALGLIGKKKEVIGINYWVSVGGSTAIFDDNNKPKPAAGILSKYFKLSALPD